MLFGQYFYQQVGFLLWVGVQNEGGFIFDVYGLFFDWCWLVGFYCGVCWDMMDVVLLCVFGVVYLQLKVFSVVLLLDQFLCMCIQVFRNILVLNRCFICMWVLVLIFFRWVLFLLIMIVFWFLCLIQIIVLMCSRLLFLIKCLIFIVVVYGSFLFSWCISCLWISLLVRNCWLWLVILFLLNIGGVLGSSFSMLCISVFKLLCFCVEIGCMVVKLWLVVIFCRNGSNVFLFLRWLILLIISIIGMFVLLRMLKVRVFFLFQWLVLIISSLVLIFFSELCVVWFIIWFMVCFCILCSLGVLISISCFFG